MDAVRVNYWTPEEDETLRRLVISGLSYTVIGERMGRNKNSVISRSKRQGFAKLSPSKPPWNKGLTRYPDRPKKPATKRPTTPGIDRELIVGVQFQCVAVDPSPDAENLSFAEMGYGRCWFPEGENPAEMTFCGARAPAGSSWCPWHRSIVFIPYAPRKPSPYRSDR